MERKRPVKMVTVAKVLVGMMMISTKCSSAARNEAAFMAVFSMQVILTCILKEKELTIAFAHHSGFIQSLFNFKTAIHSSITLSSPQIGNFPAREALLRPCSR
jgi:hypothetical protein